ncbi:CIC11C00000000255 [Sungouiella intermedia]|uniref:CIC11C00000000255 n=1 Tax=Sungouiella intermedia TaxID=45354 RepID=A0A1L0C3A5_9ASCO|nr:CIC11C00000000255 [[Candida] intermedia]
MSLHSVTLPTGYLRLQVQDGVIQNIQYDHHFGSKSQIHRSFGSSKCHFPVQKNEQVLIPSAHGLAHYVVTKSSWSM